MKKVFLIHGWGGGPSRDWFPWLKEKLEKKNYEVVVPEMPDTNNPKIDKWIKKLNEVIKPDENTILIGHSIGCQAIMRYLERLPEEIKFGKIIFVAGWFNLTDEVWDEDYTKEIANPWIKTPINFEKIKIHCDDFIAINSDDDPYVPISDNDVLRKRLGATKIVLKNKGHICEESGAMKFPEILRFLK